VSFVNRSPLRKFEAIGIDGDYVGEYDE
jgi:hypothetical protein